MSCLILYKEGNPKKAKNGYKNGKQVTTGSDALRKMLQKMFLFCMRKIHLVRKVPIKKKKSSYLLRSSYAGSTRLRVQWYPIAPSSQQTSQRTVIAQWIRQCPPFTAPGLSPKHGMSYIVI